MTTPLHGTAARALGPFLVGIAALVYAALVLGSCPDRMPGIDSHYHFVMAEAIWHGDLAPDPSDNLPLTILADMPVDHYWGFHLLTSPWAAMEDREIGMKSAAAVFFALLMVAVCCFMRGVGVAHPWVWALAPLAMTTLPWRYLMLRGGQLMVPMVLSSLWLSFVSRSRWRRALLVLVAYTAALMYQGVVVMVMLHAVGVATIRLARLDGFDHVRTWEPLLSLAGLGLALLATPYTDASCSPLKLFVYHVGAMGLDWYDLYPTVAEFHGIPLGLVASSPSWAILAVATLVTAAWVVTALVRRRSVPPMVVLLGGLAVAGAVLSAGALRMIEYAVPLMVAFVARGVTAAVGSRRAPGLAVAIGVGLLTLVGIASTTSATVTHLTGPGTTATSLYQGAGALLAAEGEHPVLDLSEADCPLLMWEAPTTRCVQGLSKYFVHHDPELFALLDAVKHLHELSPEEANAVLDQVAALDVRLIAVRPLLRTGGLHPNPFIAAAATMPDRLAQIFVSPEGGGIIYALLPKDPAPVVPSP